QALGFAKRLQEAIGGSGLLVARANSLNATHLAGAGAFWIAVEFGKRIDRLALGIEQRLGWQSANGRAGEIDFVSRVPFIGFRAELTCAAVHDLSQKALEIEAAVGDMAGESVEQSRIAGWVRNAEIVNRLDKSTPKQVVPDEINLRLNE